MITFMNTLLAGEHAAELRRVAERRRAIPHGPRDAGARPIELRLGRPDEAAVVHRLAALDDAPALEGQALLALIDGDAVAALSLHDRRVVANPFVLTGEAVALLRLRARHLSGGPARHRSRRSLRARRAFAGSRGA